MAILLTFVTSCGTLAQQPPTEAVRLAVSQQMANAQQAIAQGLGMSGGISSQPKPNFTLDKLDIKSRERLSAKSFQSKGYPSELYKVTGTLTTTLAASNHKIQQNAPFEVYLGTTPKETNAQTDNNSENSPKDGSKDGPESDIETWFMISPDALKPPQ